MIEITARFIYKTLFFFLPSGHPWDHVAHFFLSAMLIIIIFAGLTIVAINESTAIFAAITSTAILGIVKEINDAKLEKNDIVQDLLADGLGICAGIAIIFCFNSI